MELLKRHRVFLVALGLLLVLVFMLAWWHEDDRRAPSADGQRSVLQEITRAVVLPFQQAVRSVSSAAGDVYQHYIGLVELSAENERLRERIAVLEETLNHHIDAALQFEALREQLRFQEEGPVRKVFAEVVGESADNLHHVLHINKGARSGIQPYDVAVLRGGVVGRVQAVTTFQASVVLIIDRRHRVPVLVQRSRRKFSLQGHEGKLRLLHSTRGLAIGGGSALRVEQLGMLADIQPGDRIVTSGLAGIFPKGLLVGQVRSVSRARHELFQSAEIEPAVDFSRVEGVFVLLRGKNATQPAFRP